MYVYIYICISVSIYIYNMRFSINGGTPKASILIGFSIVNQPFRGAHIYRTPRIDNVSPCLQELLWSIRLKLRWNNFGPCNPLWRTAKLTWRKMAYVLSFQSKSNPFDSSPKAGQLHSQVVSKKYARVQYNWKLVRQATTLKPRMDQCKFLWSSTCYNPRGGQKHLNQLEQE